MARLRIELKSLARISTVSRSERIVVESPSICPTKRVRVVVCDAGGRALKS
ncbi:MAG TPA: hypothetical protein VLI39_01680 [Sedimentisphaerales bacterium]|nr:hypothetical protein [Sedimentisphaerales bacterium]